MNDERGTERRRNEFRRFLQARDHRGKRVIESPWIPVNPFRECLLRVVNHSSRGQMRPRMQISFSARIVAVMKRVACWQWKKKGYG